MSNYSMISVDCEGCTFGADTPNKRLRRRTNRLRASLLELELSSGPNSAAATALSASISNLERNGMISAGMVGTNGKAAELVSRPPGVRRNYQDRD